LNGRPRDSLSVHGEYLRGCYRRTGGMEPGDTVISLPLQPLLFRWLGRYILEHQDYLTEKIRMLQRKRSVKTHGETSRPTLR
jgi:hypothetical protein